MKRAIAILLVLVAGAWASAAPDLTLPNRATSLKFAAIGDNGTGEPLEYDVGRQMTAFHARFPFVAVTLADYVFKSADRRAGDFSGAAARFHVGDGARAAARNDGIWIQFGDRAWIAAGRAVRRATLNLVRIGEYAGAPVYRHPDADEDVIYLIWSGFKAAS